MKQARIKDGKIKIDQKLYENEELKKHEGEKVNVQKEKNNEEYEVYSLALTKICTARPVKPPKKKIIQMSLFP